MLLGLFVFFARSALACSKLIFLCPFGSSNAGWLLQALKSLKPAKTKVIVKKLVLMMKKPKKLWIKFLLNCSATFEDIFLAAYLQFALFI